MEEHSVNIENARFIDVLGFTQCDSTVYLMYDQLPVVIVWLVHVTIVVIPFHFDWSDWPLENKRLGEARGFVGSLEIYASVQ